MLLPCGGCMPYFWFSFCLKRWNRPIRPYATSDALPRAAHRLVWKSLQRQQEKEALPRAECRYDGSAATAEDRHERKQNRQTENFSTLSHPLSPPSFCASFVKFQFFPSREIPVTLYGASRCSSLRHVAGCRQWFERIQNEITKQKRIFLWFCTNQTFKI